MKKSVIIFIKILKRIYSEMKKLLWKLLYLSSFKCGKKTCFYPRTHIVIDDAGKVKIGNNCFFNCNCSINSLSKIEIGNDCIFGENVCMYDHNHKYKESEHLIRNQGFVKKDIVIGNNCWIGSNVTILAGANIGNNVVIGAGTVITKNVPDNCVVFGDSNIKIMSIESKR